MDNLQAKLIKYQKSISLREITDALKVYHETGDLKVRQNIIYRYMPLVKKQVLSFNIIGVESEDLEQMAYLALIRCVDKFNPYGKRSFTACIFSAISSINEKFNSFEETVNLSLTNLDIYSNDILEISIVDNISKEKMVNQIIQLLEEYPNQRSAKMFKLFYGINSTEMDFYDITDQERVSHQYFYDEVTKILLYLFLKLNSDYGYYPSKKIEKFLFDNKLLLSGHRLPKEYLDELKKVSLDELDYLVLYSEDDLIKDSHELVKNINNSIKRF